MKTLIITIMVICFAPLLSGCGFQPIYAEQQTGKGIDGSKASLLGNITVANIISTRDAGEGNLAVQPILRRALESRLLQGASSTDEYELFVTVTPVARRLAVQLTGTVTRLNYTLNSRYRLVHKQTGAMVNGTPTAIASFNQVTSQYSSLFAEREAVEKSATRLAEQIERDILLQHDVLKKRIAIAEEKGQKREEGFDQFEDPEDDTPFDPDFDPELIPGR